MLLVAAAELDAQVDDTATASPDRDRVLTVGESEMVSLDDEHQSGRPTSNEPAFIPPTVFSDGTGLPAGSGTAKEGAVFYLARCAGCHGAEGEGARAVELVGDPALIASEYPDRGVAVHWPYAPPLFDYIRRAMPPEQPWSLSASETYAVVARVLELNGLVDPETIVDAALLSTLVMPNVNGFEDAKD